MEDDINNFETVINAVDSIRKMANFGEEFLPGLEEDIIEAKKNLNMMKKNRNYNKN